MKNIVLTIGREYGSGGRYIAQEVAKKLSIPFYDKNLITETYEKNNCNYSKLEQYDETKNNEILDYINMLSGSYNNTLSADVYRNLVSNTIKELADSGSCVILGRNSNNILKNRKNVINIFIYSNNLEFKLERKMKLENIDRKEALKRLKAIDKKRKKYYEYVNDKAIWGHRKGYDYLIDSSILGIDGTIDMIVELYKKLEKK